MSKEFKEWFKVIEIADMLGLSKVSVYNKIKTLNSDVLQGLQKKEKGITYFHIKAVNIIKASFNQEQNISQDINEYIATDTENYDVRDDYINTLKEQLKEKDLQINNQLAAKDLQINNLNERLKQEQDLNKNNQILQLRQPQDIKALEEHFTELDTKLLDIKEQMQKRKDYQEQEQKGFFKKFFKKQT